MKKYLNSLPEIKKKAKKKLFYKTWNWAECGAEQGNTLKANLDSFKNVIPHVLEKQLFIAHLEDDKRKKISDIYKKGSNCCILIGPEGDFTIDEISLAKKNNFRSITLGDSRLRTETAAIYAVSVVRMLNGR